METKGGRQSSPLVRKLWQRPYSVRGCLSTEAEKCIGKRSFYRRIECPVFFGKFQMSFHFLSFFRVRCKLLLSVNLHIWVIIFSWLGVRVIDRRISLIYPIVGSPQSQGIGISHARVMVGVWVEMTLLNLSFPQYILCFLHPFSPPNYGNYSHQ